jgi:ABC-type uncharacterized transport system involved in gliding motility auxiliary subunit
VAGTALSAGAQRLRIALAIPALLGIFFLGMAILNRRAIRLDLTPERRYTLSDHARKILDTLPAEVRILAFLRTQDPRNPAIRDLLERVEARSPRVRVDIVDVNKSPALARQYGVDSYGAVVVESEGRRRLFSNPREEVLMAALLQVTRQQRKIVGVVVGHGEGDFNDADRHRGFSTARVLLEQEYYEVRPVSLLGDEVPPETNVLVIAGPRKDFLPEELAALDRYLQRPGQALVMLDPMRAAELTAFLRRFGVELPPDVVVDPAARLYGGEYLTMQIPLERSRHPILAPLDAPPLFSLTRSVGVVAGESDGLNAVPFLRTSDDSWVTTDPAVLRGGPAALLSRRDRPGPVTVGIEVAFRILTPPGAEAQQGRLVVYGNAEFANNFFIEFLGNKDLFVNTIGWLAREPQAISQRPRRQQLGLQQFYVSAEQGNRVFWTTAVVEPALLAAIGLGLALRRRWSA